MRNDSRTDVSALWSAYKESGSQDAREHLILNYSPLVKYVAGRVSTGLPQTVETADLISYGLFGLIDAINKFEPERGIKFETYAIARIKGAIIDELRTMDWVPRSVRSKGRQLETAYAALERRLQRTPSDAELADEMQVSGDELRVLFSQLSYTSVISFEDLSIRNNYGDGSDAIAAIPDRTAEDPVAIFETEEMKEILASAINRLPERERIVIALYYFEGLTLKEIGRALGVTESRISQLHTKAVLRMRSRLQTSQVYAETTTQQETS